MLEVAVLFAADILAILVGKSGWLVVLYTGEMKILLES